MAGLGRGINQIRCLSGSWTCEIPGYSGPPWWQRQRRGAAATHCRGYASSSEPSVTKVERILLDTIKATGPISYATYMQMCLSHPTEGYYMNPKNTVIGSRGDFTTSPEISQVFGELTAIWLLSQWLHTGASRDIRLIELGPGRGTLMNDILLVLDKIAVSRSAEKEIHLVENSPAMIQQQKANLKPGNTEVNWHSSIDDVAPDPSKFSMIVAHEFFDALPFHLVQKMHSGWQEILLASSDSASAEVRNIRSETQLTTSLELPSAVLPGSPKPRFREVLSPSPTASSTLLGLSSNRFHKLPAGSRLEISPTSFKIARHIAELVHTEGEEQSAGCALIVDYGGDKAYGDSFRAFKEHKIVDVFHHPGECDLTVNVDFQYLKEAMTGLATSHGPLSQAAFLTGMGLAQRVEVLQKAAKTPERADEIGKAAQRLVDLTGMGRQYQIMGLSGKTRTPLPAEVRWPFLTEDEKTSER